VNHRIVSTVVMIIVALFVGAVALFAIAAEAVAPRDGVAATPNNPHPPASRTASCPDCHNAELGSIPTTHRHFSVKTCGSCHRPTERVRVPHSIAMGDSRCPLCHGEPARDFGFPVSHLRYESGECLLCHPGDPGNDDEVPPPAGLSKSPADFVTHPLDGTFKDCSYCHHVESRSTLPENHRDFAVDTCMDCHEPEVPEESVAE